MTSTLSRKKKALLLLCMLCCIFVAYLQIFTIRSKANAVVGAGYGDAKVLGFPMDLYYYSTRDGGDFAGTSFGVIPNFNVFIDTDNLTPSWAEGFNGSPPVQDFSMTYLNASDNADISLTFVAQGYPRYLESAFDIVFTDILSFREDYGLVCILPYSAPYTVSYTVVSTDGVNLVRRSFDSFSLSPTVVGNLYYYFTLPLSVFNETFVQSYGFFNYNGERAVWLTDFRLNLPSPPPGSIGTNQTYYFNAERSPSVAYPYQDFVSDFKDNLLTIYDSSEVIIDFEDLSWTDWLVNSVGSFMNFEFIPGFSISGIFALLVGMSLFLVFLKVFAGG